MARTLRLVRQTWLAEGVRELRFRDPAGGELPGWEPGAHVTVMLPNGVGRDYSLCGDPADRAEWTVAVLREPASRGGSSYVHERLGVGELLAVDGPRNNFPLRPAGRYLLVAGGIGVTPILAMARELASAGAAWSMLYCGRERSGMAYLPELRELAGDALAVHCDDEHGGPPDLDAVLGELPTGTHVYCCGPEGLLAAVADRLPESVPLSVERFRADAPAPLAADAEPEFDVVCAGSGVRARVAAGVSILDALAGAGVEVPSSCREGICGTCETKVLAGEPDHRDLLLSDEEKRSGQTMLLCVSRCRSPELLLDLS
ncbi:PDR/VanB family oxidoreductase [Pseudonocardia acaciae]|uniref:PDR/VanB family oxidoreductase n=1 Tax=Pseudonocardia acaciae TaxID=551276 RepID=UPI00048D8558|nr:PDR/VanB family oxidoreductase [Pseudonocardia acaciae]